MRTATWCLLIAVFALAGCGDYEPLDGNRASRHEDRASDLVLRYCAYDARSVPNLERCLRRVKVGEVRRDDDNAGHYATGETFRCRRDAGPYCGDLGPFTP